MIKVFISTLERIIFKEYPLKSSEDELVLVSPSSAMLVNILPVPYMATFVTSDMSNPTEDSLISFSNLKTESLKDAIILNSPGLVMPDIIVGA